MRFFRKRTKKKGKKEQNIWKFGQKCTKLENNLKKGRWLRAIIAHNKLLGKTLPVQGKFLVLSGGQNPQKICVLLHLGSIRTTKKIFDQDSSYEKISHVVLLRMPKHYNTFLDMWFINHLNLLRCVMLYNV